MYLLSPSCRPRPQRHLLLAFAFLLAGLLGMPGLAGPSFATPEPISHGGDLPPLEGDFVSAILMDARTGEILGGKDIDLRRQPASMVKMMTQLIALEYIAAGDIALTDLVTVSARASRTGGSRVWLKHREQFTMEQMLEALAIHSANDVAVAIAEHIAGSVEAFVDLMNARAAELGLTDTEFHSVHGLNPAKGQSPDLSTVRDMANLGRQLLQHPLTLSWSSQATAPFRNGEFTLYNPNRLVGTYRGLDGLKTGFTTPAGYCVTATAVQRGVRLISVVMGCPSDRGRATETTRLLSHGFNLFGPVTLVEKAGSLDLTIPVQGGRERRVGVVVAEELQVTVMRERGAAIELRHEVPPILTAPIAAGEKLGEVVALLDGHELGRADLLAATTVEKGSWYHRLLR